MKKKAEREIKVPVTLEGFNTAKTYLDELIDRHLISPVLASETMQIFEALFNLIMLQETSPDTLLTVSCVNRLGDISLKIGYEGARLVAPEDDDAMPSPEARILKAYGDKTTFRYHSGYNVVRISVHKRLASYIIPCAAAILLATIVYAIISFTMDSASQKLLMQEYVFPLEKLFGNAVLMVGAPVTFFTLTKNATDIFVVTESSSGLKRLQVKVLITSIIAILLAIAMSQIVLFLFGFMISDTTAAINYIAWSFEEFVSPVVSSNILSSFGATSPLPLIVIALLVVYALCSVGKSFDMLKSLIEAGYELFSWMLRAVMAILPIACFLSFLDILLDSGFMVFVEVLCAMAFALIGLCTLLAMYAIRLRIAGIAIMPFAKKLVPLLRENFMMAAATDAVPFNIRYCAKNYRMDRDLLEREMPIMAQINLDGNCFIIMFVTMVFMAIWNLNVSWISVLAIGTLVLFLSFGAPCQPGGILIGLIIIISYLGVTEAIPVAIYSEVLLSAFQNSINVIGDVVTIAEEDKRAAKARAQ